MGTQNDPDLDELLGLPQRYRGHCYWYEGERVIRKIMRKSEGRTPLWGLPLASLKSIEMAGPSESWTPGPKVKRRERETGYTYYCVTCGKGNRHWNAHLSFALRVLHHNQRSITTLELHRTREILVDEMFPVPELPHLKKLALNLRYQYGEYCQYNLQEWEDIDTPEQKLAPYLAHAASLETLKLSQDLGFKNRFNSDDPDDDPDSACMWIDGVGILASALWPKLRTICFKTFLTRSSSLLHFLQLHSHSLQSIRFDRPVSRMEVWQPLAPTIRERFATPDCSVWRSDDCWQLKGLSEVEEDWPWFTRRSRWLIGD